MYRLLLKQNSIMRIRSTIFRILCLIIAAFIAAEAGAQKKKGEAAVAPDIHAVSKSENLSFPAVPEKQHKFISDYMLREAQAIVKQGYKVETERQGEVIVVTIPASSLFMPNSTELEVSGQKLLDPFTAYLKTEGRFKMLLAMHSDDTGSASYLEKLTGDRLKAVTSYMEKHYEHPEQIAGYALSDNEPVRPNSNIANRAQNRRLEIYIVPDQELLRQATKR